MKLFVFICCILTITGCASSKNVQENTIENRSNEIAQLKSSLDSLQIDIQKQSRITAEKLSNLKVESKTVYLSKPDSTGKQHKTKETVTNIHHESQSTIKKYEELSMMFMELSGKVDTLLSMIESSHAKDVKVKKLSWWDLYKDRIFFVLILMLLFPDLYKLMKKLKNLSTR